jgi:hypothetical protein
MEHLSSAMEQQNQQVQWRRDKVQELCSKGYSQREIYRICIDIATRIIPILHFFQRNSNNTFDSI